MAQPALHFAVGSAIGTVLSVLIPPVRRRWFKLGPMVATLGGIWACLPDLDHIRIAFFDRDHHRWEFAHGYPRLVNVFFFHGFLDERFPGKGTIIGILWLIGLYSVFFLLLAWRVHVLERNLERLELKGPRS